MADHLAGRFSEAQGVLHAQQLSFVVYDGTKRAAWQTRWRREDKTAVLTLLQAPKTFGSPITQRKRFKPPFKVRLVLQYRGQLQMSVKLEACALGEPAVQQLVGLHSEGSRMTPLPSLAHQHELENSMISFCIQVQEGQVPALKNGMCEHVEDQEFSELRFGKSSRMHKRWILFSCRLGVDTLYLLYKIPTIVLSRKTDQFEKACSILLRSLTEKLPDLEGGERADINPQPQSLPPSDSIGRWIVEKYDAAYFARPLKKHDLLCLQAQALSNYQQFGDISSEMRENSHNFKKFKHWFLMCLRSLKQEEDLWSSSDPIKICDLIIDRSAAEDILMDEPVGTFLVRLCSEPGAFAISVKDTALYLLDIPTGKRIAKTSVFSTNVHFPLCYSLPQAPRLSCPGVLVSGPAQTIGPPVTVHNLFPSLAACKEVQPSDCRKALLHDNSHKVPNHSCPPTKPTKEQLMHLAAVCGFDVSQGLDPIFQSKELAGASSIDSESELAKYCGIDSNQLLEPSTASGISGLLFDMPTNSMSIRSRNHSSKLDSVQHVEKRSRLGSH